MRARWLIVLMPMASQAAGVELEIAPGCAWSAGISASAPLLRAGGAFLSEPGSALGGQADGDVELAHAYGEVGFRFGAEGIAVYYDPDRDTRGIHGFAEKAPMGFGFMLSYWFPGSTLSLDLETAVVAFLASSSSFNGSGPPAGVVFRPGIRYRLPAVPLYLRAAIPINTGNVTMAHPSRFQHETFDLRTGVGVVLPLGLINPFLEANIDFPLGGGAGPSAFSAWTFAVDIGVDVRLGL